MREPYPATHARARTRKRKRTRTCTRTRTKKSIVGAAAKHLMATPPSPSPRRFRGTNQRYKKKAMRERASAKPSIRTKGQISKAMRTAVRKGGKLELDTGKSDAEIEREDKAIVLSDDVVEEMKRMLYNWQVYNTREDVARLDENDRGGPPVEIVEVDEDRQVIKKEAPTGARKTWEDFR